MPRHPLLLKTSFRLVAGSVSVPKRRDRSGGLREARVCVRQTFDEVLSLSSGHDAGADSVDDEMQCAVYRDPSPAADVASHLVVNVLGEEPLDRASQRVREPGKSESIKVRARSRSRRSSPPDH